MNIKNALGLLFGLFILAGSVSAQSGESWKIGSFPAPISRMNTVLPDDQFEKGTVEDYANGVLDPALYANDRFIVLRGTLEIENPQDACLVLYPFAYPTDVFLNGHLIHRQGISPGMDSSYYSSFAYTTRTIPIPVGEISPEQTVSIEIHSYPVFETTPPALPYAKTCREAESIAFSKNLFNVYLIDAAVISAFMLALYFFFLTVARRDTARTTLFFALACIGFGFSYLPILLAHDGWAEEFFFRISRMGILLSSISLTMFFSELTGILKSNRIYHTAMIVVGVIAGLSLSTPVGHAAITGAFNLVTFTVVGPLLLLNLVLIILGIIIKKSVESRLLLLPFLFLIFASVIDIINSSSGSQPFAWMVPYGYIVVVIAIFFVLSWQQAALHQTIIVQGRKLEKRNADLKSILDNISRLSTDVVDTSRQLFESSQQIAAFTNQQAASVKEIVTSVEESTTATRHIGEQAGEVVHRSEETRNQVVQGQSLVLKNKSKMNSIREVTDVTITGIQTLNDKIESIWDILNLINSIAEQTRIIAFNAELEATAAGESGKNFEVVAHEVRRLADHTVESTRKIREQIQEIQTSSERLIGISRDGTEVVHDGVISMQNTQDLFVSIRNYADEATTAAETIAGSVSQVSTAYDQIFITLKQISEGVEMVAQSSVGKATVAERLRSVAEELQGLTRTFEAN